MTKSKRVSAIVRGPQSHFSKTGVLHPPGSLVPFNPEDPENTGVPAEEVSNDDFRTIKVQCRDRGERWEEERKVRVQFRPVWSRHAMRPVWGNCLSRSAGVCNPLHNNL